MQTAGIRDLKKELQALPHEKVVEYCLSLAKFKKECKELLTYLVFESENEEHYRNSIKDIIELEFMDIHSRNVYMITKKVRKIIRLVKKYARFSKDKETDAELLLYFCETFHRFIQGEYEHTFLPEILKKQLEYTKKKINKLHEDLQYDFGIRVNDIENSLW